jgi:hypothetical protein
VVAPAGLDWEGVACMTRAAGGLLLGGPQHCVWVTDVLPRLRCDRNPKHFVVKMGVGRAAYNRAQLSKLVRALRDVPYQLPSEDTAFVADVDVGAMGPYAVLNAMTRRLWKTPEAAASVVASASVSGGGGAKRRRLI